MPIRVAWSMGAARAVRAMRAELAAGAIGGVQLADDLGKAAFIIIAVVVIVIADVARLLRPFPFLLVGLEDGGLDHLAAGGVDRVSDVGVQLGPAVGIAGGAILVELAAALVAVA